MIYSYESTNLNVVDIEAVSKLLLVDDKVVHGIYCECQIERIITVILRIYPKDISECFFLLIKPDR